jgi:hypothetical protein
MNYAQANSKQLPSWYGSLSLPYIVVVTSTPGVACWRWEHVHGTCNQWVQLLGSDGDLDKVSTSCT